MQYADIALPIKIKNSNSTFTYRIPPGLLVDMTAGQRVYVPFGSRRMIGTVLSLRATPPKIRGPLKEITDLVEPFPIFDISDLRLASDVASHYGASIGEVLDIASPMPAKRTVKSLTAFRVEKSNSIQQKATVYGLYTTRLVRFKQYLSLIEKAIDSQGQVLIIFPNEQLVSDFAVTIPTKIRSVIIPPTNELTAHYTAWVAGRISQAEVVIGTRKAIFAPLNRPRLIIIDGLSEYGHKEEQFPYYHTARVAKLRSKIVSCHLVLGDIAPRLEEWNEQRFGKLTFLKTLATKQSAITLVDTNTHRGIISEVLLLQFEHHLSAGGKIAVYFNRKGSGRYFHCRSCESAIYCPRCDNLLTVIEDEPDHISLNCSLCAYEQAAPLVCPVCQGYQLAAAGMGIKTLAKKLSVLFPNYKVEVLEDGPMQPDDLPDILVGTTQLLSLPANIHFNLLAIFHLDQLIHSHRWDANEAAYLKLNQLRERADAILLHSAKPDHPVVRAFCTQKADLLYNAEWESRKLHGYPPAGDLIRLTIAGTNKEKIQAEADALFKLYRDLLPDSENSVMPPTPFGSGKRRGKFRYQLIIKSKLTRLILQNKPAKWQIDPEPLEF